MKTTKPKFSFNKEEHYYELDGKRLYGVTTVLGVIAKPALIGWAANMAVDTLQKVWHNAMTKEEFDKLCEEARSAHRKKKEKAGDIGTMVHSAVEAWIKNKTEPVLLDETGLKMFNHFRDWATKNNFKFLESEKQLYSKEMWLGGTTDMVFMKGDQKFVGDIKTSSGIYPEMFYQMAAYRMMLEEMGEKDFAGSVVINLKKDGTFAETDVQYHYDYETDKSAFLGALAIFKANESYKPIKK